MGNLLPSEEPLTSKQVHELTGWSITSINRWAASGELPPVRKLPGRTGAYLFDPAVVARFRNSREEAA